MEATDHTGGRRNTGHAGAGWAAKRADPPDRALLERLLRFLDYGPRTKAEVRGRLRRWEYSREIAEDAVAYLESAGLVDDSGFARLYMEQMIAKGFGERRVREKLLQKGLDRNLVDVTLEDYPGESDLERALGVGEARMRGFDRGDSRAASRRIHGFLLRRGYPHDVAREAARRLSRVDSHDRPE